ncbi:MAG: MFS transporter, partial [Marinosulfonomonas sp.]|nr:MFS transporter [Marinosulfonomonas sp.]
YWGGVLALAIMLPLFVENANGVTLIGNPPIFGFDAELREGTRFVGPFTAIWFVIGMIPFFLWVREKPADVQIEGSASDALKGLWGTIKSLPKRTSLFSFLTSSLFYRDALNGLYGFGAIYAHHVLDWSITLIGVFGVISAITAAIFSYIGGKLDHRFGPKPILIGAIIALITVSIIVVSMTRESLFGFAFAPDSQMSDIIFFICGGIIGAAGGMLQASSRTMMVRHADPDRPTEAFGLYALSGKATAFLAPGLIAITSEISGNQRIGISPLIFLFALGLILLIWVKAEGEHSVS